MWHWQGAPMGGLEVCAALHLALDRVVLLQARAWLRVWAALAEG